MRRTATICAHAKVNPLLRVLGKRHDGFHELETVLLALDLSDRITVTLTGGAAGSVTVETTGPFATADIADDEDHLAVRGARVALECAGMDRALHVAVEKNIPSRAGLGGGSADAAAAAAGVLALSAASGHPIVPDLEERVAFGLGGVGSDCAFFYVARDTGAGAASGRGETVLPLRTGTPRDVVLVTPECVCSTPDVFQALGRTPGHLSSSTLDAVEAVDRLGGSTVELQRWMANDLEPAARRAVPDLERWFTLLDGLGLGHMRLAGSGSSFFGVFDGGGAAAEAHSAILRAAAAAGLAHRLCIHTRTSPKALSEE